MYSGSESEAEVHSDFDAESTHLNEAQVTQRLRMVREVRTFSLLLKFYYFLLSCLTNRLERFFVPDICNFIQNFENTTPPLLIWPNG